MPFGPAPAGLDQRIEGWEKRLSALVNANRTTPYQYGRFDCATFSIDAVREVTGVSLLPGVEFPTGWLSAAKFLIRHGLDDVEEFAIAALGQIPGDGQDTMPGDLVSWRAGGEPHLGVRMDAFALTPVSNGLRVVRRSEWVCGWWIGRPR